MTDLRETAKLVVEALFGHGAMWPYGLAGDGTNLDDDPWFRMCCMWLSQQGCTYSIEPITRGRYHQAWRKTMELSEDYSVCCDPSFAPAMLVAEIMKK